jgi:hypothetical protein
MNRFFVILVLLILGKSAFSQTQQTDPKQYFYALEQELEGVYQIQMINSRMTPMITTEMLELIKEKQSETEEVIFYYRETIRIVIKSKQDVNSGLRFTEDEYIIYINQ